MKIGNFNRPIKYSSNFQLSYIAKILAENFEIPHKSKSLAFFNHEITRLQASILK